MKQAKQLPNVYLHESIKNIDRLSEKVCEFVSVDPRQHTLHVLHRQQEVVIIVEEPIFANQLKYQQKAILKHLNHTLLSQYKTIRIKLSPPRMVNGKRTVKTKALPESVSQLLDQVRQDLDVD